MIHQLLSIYEFQSFSIVIKWYLSACNSKYSEYSRDKAQ